MYNTESILSILADCGIEARAESLHKLPYHSNNLSGRALYILDKRFVIKVFGAGSEAAYRTESAVLPVLENHKVGAPKLIHSRFDAKLGGIVLLQHLPGTVLNDVYQKLSADDYAQLLFALGRLMHSLHTIPARDLLGIPFGPQL